MDQLVNDAGPLSLRPIGPLPVRLLHPGASWRLEVIPVPRYIHFDWIVRNQQEKRERRERRGKVVVTELEGRGREGEKKMFRRSAGAGGGTGGGTARGIFGGAGLVLRLVGHGRGGPRQGAADTTLAAASLRPPLSQERIEVNLFTTGEASAVLAACGCSRCSRHAGELQSACALVNCRRISACRDRWSSRR